MVPLLLLPLLWGGSLQEYPGYQLQLTESVTVQEGLCVLVLCSFSYPWDRRRNFPRELYIYWFRNGDSWPYSILVATNNPEQQVDTETQGRFRLVGDPRTNNCSLSIRDARKSDTGIYSFRVERGYYVNYSYRDKKLHLLVTDLTQKPDIHLLEPLESGRPTKLTCSLPGSCEGGRPLWFSWEGTALHSLDPKTLRSSVLTFTPRLQDHGTNLTCWVKLQGAQVATERTIQLNISYAPQNLTIHVLSGNVTELKHPGNGSCLQVLEGASLLLDCVTESNPEATVSWAKMNGTLSPSQARKPKILELPWVELEHEGEFICRAQNPLGSQQVSLTLCVHYPPKLLTPSCSWEDQSLRCNCSSRAHPAASLGWRLGKRLVVGNHSNASFTVTSSSMGPWANSSLSLSGGLSSGLRFSCEAMNIHGSQNVTVLLLPGNLVSSAGMVSAALGGAGAMTLLSLCLCLTFFCIVKTRRKQAAGKREGTDDEDPVMGTVAWGSRQKPQPESPPEQVSPAGDAPPSEEQQELHYASLSFHQMKFQEPQDQEATSTNEYSEIGASK
nr:LOW QUALITY PROTEIN: sialic acid-binding Ig-like lectin 5 [Equus asinus]